MDLIEIFNNAMESPSALFKLLFVLCGGMALVAFGLECWRRSKLPPDGK